MFKFLKSKKGFTLVELMIVVVIMAILVAVAVPIFSAVTKKAKIKTCTANQREIASQINNAAMTATSDVSGSLTLTTQDGAETAQVSNDAGISGITSFTALFQKLPFCPVEDAVITVKVSALDNDGVKVEVGCNQDEHVGNDVTINTNQGGQGT